MARGSYDITRLRVTRADLTPKEVSTLVSPEVARTVEEAYKYIIKSDAELVVDEDGGVLRGRPYGHPVHGRISRSSWSKAGLFT